MSARINQALAAELHEYILVIQQYLNGEITGTPILELDDRLTDNHSSLLSELGSKADYEIFKMIINMYNPEEKKQFPLSGLVDDKELKPYAEKMLAELLQMQSQYEKISSID